jgi:hypothetical protein
VRHVSPPVDGFEVEVDGLHRAAGQTVESARALEVAATAVLGLALGPDEVGPRGAALADAVARFAGRAADRLVATGDGLTVDARAVRTAARGYVDVDRAFARELEGLA